MQAGERSMRRLPLRSVPAVKVSCVPLAAALVGAGRGGGAGTSTRCDGVCCCCIGPCCVVLVVIIVRAVVGVVVLMLITLMVVVVVVVAVSGVGVVSARLMSGDVAAIRGFPGEGANSTVADTITCAPLMVVCCAGLQGVADGVGVAVGVVAALWQSLWGAPRAVVTVGQVAWRAIG